MIRESSGVYSGFHSLRFYHIQGLRTVSLLLSYDLWDRFYVWFGAWLVLLEKGAMTPTHKLICKCVSSLPRKLNGGGHGCNLAQGGKVTA
jgi:hypothetical protein